ncbi:MAG: type II toxin-antitoxin system RelE/ParE family toxin [Planctomycetota bacterium]|nr:type II toxin-antitoxin system RelE/ParE family toxin [Planctomycetota bacterium]
MTGVTVSPEAARDIEAIVATVTEESGPRRADLLAERLIRAIARLADAPKSGRQRDDIRRGLRCIVIRPYVVLYRIDARCVRIIRVVHGARDFRTLFGE